MRFCYFKGYGNQLVANKKKRLDKTEKAPVRFFFARNALVFNLLA